MWNISVHDIGTEELAHMEMVCTIVYQLTKNLSPEEIKASGFDKYYVDHTLALWPQAAGGIPFNACQFQSKGDPITDLTEDLAAEQKARTTYDNILRLVHDQEICDPIRFLRAREIVHFQRFGEPKRSYVSNKINDKISNIKQNKLSLSRRNGLSLYMSIAQTKRQFEDKLNVAKTEEIILRFARYNLFCGTCQGYSCSTLLSVQKGNQAVRFYERLGYKITDEKLDHAGHKDYNMLKELGVNLREWKTEDASTLSALLNYKKL